MTKDEMIKVMSSNGPWQRRKWATSVNDPHFHDFWDDDLDPSWNWGYYEYRIKPEGKKVPLGPEDFPAGTAFRWDKWISSSWVIVLAVGWDTIRVDFGGRVIHLTYDDMASKGGQRSLDGGKTWLPCYKIE